jgi:putative GTP pyrophosphokinase
MSTNLEKLRSQYEDRFPKLEQGAKVLQNQIEELFKGDQRIDFISARAKGIESFLGKAGKAKYKYPLGDIQDQIGVRIVVKYKSELVHVRDAILDEFSEIEDVDKEDKDHTRFGYAGIHLICFLPEDIRGSTGCEVKFFEMQLFTIFQHAWAEANHDLGYKSDSELDFETNKLIHFTAAQAWGADKIFDELWIKKKNSKEGS